MGALKHGRRLGDMGGWPATEAALVRLQDELGRAAPAAWTPAAGRPLLGGCYVCFARGTAGPGGAGDPGVAGAAVVRGRRLLGAATAAGPAGAPYRPALLALREGPLLAGGPPPAGEAGATAPLLLDGEPVGCWLRTRAGVRPVAVHAAWRTSVDAAVAVVLAAATRRPARTPE